MTQITIPAQVVNGHLIHEQSLTELEGKHVLATLVVAPVTEATDGSSQKHADSASTAERQKWRDKLESYRTIENGWDSYRAPAPSPHSIEDAFGFLDVVAKSQTKPARLAPSVVGGVGFTFKSGIRKVYVEFRNTGSAHALFSDGATDPVLSKFESTHDEYMNIVLRIRKYLDE